MPKRKPNYFFIILSIIFIIFVSLSIAYESGYYEANISRKSKITQEKIEEFERDVKEGKEVDLKDYIDNDYVDYSSKVSKIGSKISNSIDNFMESGLSNFFDVISKLFM